MFVGLQQFFSGREDDVQRHSKLTSFLMRHMDMTDEFHGMKVRVTIAGKKVFTPVLVVFLTIGTADVIFAVDSIPAIYGITQSPFIVFTANVFALMGLRRCPMYLPHAIYGVRIEAIARRLFSFTLLASG